MKDLINTFGTVVKYAIGGFLALSTGVILISVLANLLAITMQWR